jgi:type IV secretory pathway VirB10-like protein
VVIAEHDRLPNSVIQPGEEMRQRNLNLLPTLIERQGFAVR